MADNCVFSRLNNSYIQSVFGLSNEDLEREKKKTKHFFLNSYHSNQEIRFLLSINLVKSNSY